MKLICCDPFTSGKNWNERTACLAEPNPIHSDTDDSNTDADPCVVANCAFGCLEDDGSCDDHSTEVARNVWDDPSHEGGALQGYCTTDAISCSVFGTQITEPAVTYILGAPGESCTNTCGIGSCDEAS